MSALLPHAAKALIPLRTGSAADDRFFGAVAETGITVVTNPSALLLSEDVTGLLTDAGRRPLWLRLDREDEDPAMLLASLVVAARRQRPDAGQATLDLMRSRPGPVHGWADLFDRLADELIALVEDRGALVLEHAHHLPAAGAALALLGRRLFPRLTRAGMSCVLLSHRDLISPALPPDAVRHVGRDLRPPAPVAAAALRAAREALGPGVDRDWPVGTDAGDLLERVARALLETAGTAERRRLGLATELEYADNHGPPGDPGDRPPPGPWWQELDDGWARIRTAWRTPLRAVLGPRLLPGRAELHRVAETMVSDGNLDRAVPLLLGLGDAEGAAGVLSAHAEDLMDLGQWETLDRWIRRLPDAVLAEHPDLLHDRGEIAAARGETTAAQGLFDDAAARFTARADHRGACRTMLAASALAATTGDLPTASARAAAAAALAEVTEDSAYRMWASWQQASVALAGGDADTAAVSFARAASAGATTEPVRFTGRLSQQLLRLRRRRERHREAQAAIDGMERETLRRLLTSVNVPPSLATVSPDGWSTAPIPLRLRFLGSAGPVASPSPALDTPTAASAELVRRDAESVPLPPAEPMLVVQMLGPLQVAFGDTPVQDAMGSRVRSLFAYLVTHRHPWPSRDALAEAIWPDATPEAARNSLHVAVHGVRRAMRAATEAPIVIRAGATYRLAPEVPIWVDTDDFEDRLRRAKEHEAAGAAASAAADYERAVEMYRGDLLADLPYEDWPALTRERLRLAYLDAVDRLGSLHFEAGQYARSADLCRRLLDLDPCREDAHRMLMRCYCRQGQAHLAMLQFRACVSTLAGALKVQPSPETVELYRRIRHHQPV